MNPQGFVELDRDKMIVQTRNIADPGGLNCTSVLAGGGCDLTSPLISELMTG